MPSLIVQHSGTRIAGVLAERTTIGRSPACDIVIPDTNISRLHAWIGSENGHLFLEDMGSRTGTLVNGQASKAKHILVNCDEIAIGPARLTYGDTSELPDGIPAVNWIARRTGQRARDLIFFCVCGKPVLTSAEYTGRTAKCHHCGQVIIVPGLSWEAARLAPVVKIAPHVSQDNPTVQSVAIIRTIAGGVTSADELVVAQAKDQGEPFCSICQCEIQPTDDVMACPTCRLPFHADCWKDNFGCSAYGCQQVNVLRQGPDICIGGGLPPPPPAGVPVAPSSAVIQSFPWEFLFLLGSVFAIPVGFITFGIPCFVLAAGSIAYAVKSRTEKRAGILVLSLVMCVGGLIAGIIISLKFFGIWTDSNVQGDS